MRAYKLLNLFGFSEEDGGPSSRQARSLRKITPSQDRLHEESGSPSSTYKENQATFLMAPSSRFAPSSPSWTITIGRDQGRQTATRNRDVLLLHRRRRRSRGLPAHRAGAFNEPARSVGDLCDGQRKGALVWRSPRRPQNAGGVKPAFEVETGQVRVVDASGDRFVVLYEERTRGARQSASLKHVRWVTAVLVRTAEATDGFRWTHIHEVQVVADLTKP